jgi:hypothetical protein
MKVLLFSVGACLLYLLGAKNVVFFFQLCGTQLGVTIYFADGLPCEALASIR